MKNNLKRPRHLTQQELAALAAFGSQGHVVRMAKALENVVGTADRMCDLALMLSAPEAQEIPAHQRADIHRDIADAKVLIAIQSGGLLDILRGAAHIAEALTEIERSNFIDEERVTH
jgi:hypothetical protein